MKAILITVDEETPIVTVEFNSSNELDELQRLVGGPLQALPYPDRRNDVTLFINEEGKLPPSSGGTMFPNMRATLMMERARLLFEGDWIAGPMIIVGLDPRTGATIDCPVTVNEIERLCNGK